MQKTFPFVEVADVEFLCVYSSFPREFSRTRAPRFPSYPTIRNWIEGLLEVYVNCFPMHLPFLLINRCHQLPSITQHPLNATFRTKNPESKLSRTVITKEFPVPSRYLSQSTTDTGHGIKTSSHQLLTLRGDFRERKKRKELLTIEFQSWMLGRILKIRDRW